MFTEGPDAPVTTEWAQASVAWLLPPAGIAPIDAGSQIAQDAHAGADPEAVRDCLLAAACAGFWEALSAVSEGDLARAYAALLEPVTEDLPAFAERLLACGSRATSVILPAR